MGTDVDARNLSTLWKQLGYVVQVEENLKAVEMQEKMNEFAQDDRHYQCDSAIVMVLSHGLPGAIVGIDGKIVPVDNLISRIDAKHCRALKNKPKLVIIQACRGGKHYSHFSSHFCPVVTGPFMFGRQR